MVLTSNRVDGFDPAVKSRIHISLPFDPPTIETRRILWEQMIGRLESKEIGFQIREVLPLVENIPMNGREISNAVNNIRAIARGEGSQVLAKHFTEFMEITKTVQGARGFLDFLYDFSYGILLGAVFIAAQFLCRRYL